MKDVWKPTKERLITGAALSLSVVTLAACGKGSEKDQGSDKIATCPAGYTVGGQKVTGARERVRQELGGAVVDLSSKLPVTRQGVHATSFYNESQKTHALVTAGSEVFYVDDSFDPARFETDTPENKIDDLSEQFCSSANGSSLYLSPEASTAVGAMRQVGVNVQGILNEVQ